MELFNEAIKGIDKQIKDLRSAIKDLESEKRDIIKKSGIDTEHPLQAIIRKYHRVAKLKPPTDEQVTDKINVLTQPFIEEKAATLIDRAFNFWLQSPFGVLGRKVLGVEKEGELAETTVGRIEVEKDGQRFTIPQEQLEEAEKQGYKRIQ